MALDFSDMDGFAFAGSVEKVKDMINQGVATREWLIDYQGWEPTHADWVIAYEGDTIVPDFIEWLNRDTRELPEQPEV